MIKKYLYSYHEETLKKVDVESFSNLQQFNIIVKIVSSGIYGNVIYLESDVVTNQQKFANLLLKINNFFNPIKKRTPKPFIFIIENDSAILRKPFNTLLFNSSIWFWCISLIDSDIDATLKLLIELIDYSKENYCKQNAKEYVDYNLRLQSNNYLLGGNVPYLYPQQYHDELVFRKRIFDISVDSHPRICKMEFNDVKFRFLLIEDDEDFGIQIVRLLKLSLSCKKNSIIWDNDIVHIKYDKKYHHEKVSELKNMTQNHIVQVKSVKDAIVLLSEDNIVFDLILMEYLLAPKVSTISESVEKERSWVLLEWLTDNKDNSKNLEYLRTSLGKSKELKTKVKANRGPLNKFWIFPATSYKKTFIDDMISSGIRLIDYYWQISNGADPVTTPYLFLWSLNNFLYLQLEAATYEMDEIENFLIKSMKGLQLINENKEFNNSFTLYMGAEYTFFVSHYMQRAVICHDKIDGSLFATYIWKEFYTKPENKDLFKLSQAIQKFYHRCAFGNMGDVRKMKQFWRELKMLIEDLPSCRNMKVDLNGFLTILNKLES